LVLLQVLIELSEYGERPVLEAEGKATARRIGAESYIECSALTQHNLKEVFDVAVRAVLVRRGIKTPRTWQSGWPLTRNGRVSRNGVMSSQTGCETQPSEHAPPTATHSWKTLFCCC